MARNERAIPRLTGRVMIGLLLAALVAAAATYVWLFGSGAVFRQGEASVREKATTLVRLKVFGDEVARLSGRSDEAYVATHAGMRRELERQGFLFRDQLGQTTHYEFDGRRCGVHSYAFTSSFSVFSEISCDASRGSQS